MEEFREKEGKKGLEGKGWEAKKGRSKNGAGKGIRKKTRERNIKRNIKGDTEDE